MALGTRTEALHLADEETKSQEISKGARTVSEPSALPFIVLSLFS